MLLTITVFLTIALLINRKRMCVKEKIIEREKEVFKDETIPVIVVGIMAYEWPSEEEERKQKRALYREREERSSWWRIGVRFTWK